MTIMAQLEGKIAVVTGGTQGLGATIARLFAERGATGIVICGRSRDKGEAKAREIQDAFGTRVVFVPADLGRVEDCRAVIAKANEEFGRVDAWSMPRRSRIAALSSTPPPSCSTRCSPSTCAVRSS
jgi:NAD(P)-dependent dehydrogenase (short-subunit alcohol dehydrogenase family)